ncbi:hypothetical protein QTP88_007257 [Uroleucon formosanum]
MNLSSSKLYLYDYSVALLKNNGKKLIFNINGMGYNGIATGLKAPILNLCPRTPTRQNACVEKPICYQTIIHSTAESAVNHNGGIGLENDGYGGRSTADYFRSKTMPRCIIYKDYRERVAGRYLYKFMIITEIIKEKKKCFYKRVKTIKHSMFNITKHFESNSFKLIKTINKIQINYLIFNKKHREYFRFEPFYVLEFFWSSNYLEVIKLDFQTLNIDGTILCSSSNLSYDHYLCFIRQSIFERVMNYNEGENYYVVFGKVRDKMLTLHSCGFFLSVTIVRLTGYICAIS